MFEYIIIGILILITLAIIALILRRRSYDKVDYLESWKLDIMNRNVATELAKIKNLNLSGETQRKFERWKERWEYILSKELADVEEQLFDAEESADRFRFPNVKKILSNIEDSLNAIEKDIENILTELDNLLEAEKDSRKEVEELYEELSLLRTSLSQRRYQFGRAETYFEGEISDLESNLKEYDDLVEEGEYTKAQEHVNEIKLQLETLVTQLEEFPTLYNKCKDELPIHLKELLSGTQEMIEEGYRIKHLQYEEEIEQHEETLSESIDLLEQGKVESVIHKIPEIEERIAEMHQTLEKEAIAKNYVDTQTENFKQMMNELANTFAETKDEVEQLKTTYYFDDKYMEKYLALEKSVTQLGNQFQEFSNQIQKENISHIDLRERLESGFKQLEELENEHNHFESRIKNLRKDELAAQQKLSEMRFQLNNVSRELQKSNIPGVPNFIWDIIEKAKQKMTQVIQSLERQPLDIAQVQHALNEAQISVDHAVDQIELLLDQSYLTEQVIQYANRYRSQYPLLAAQLSEAERLFRSFEYELALEHAAKAIEEIEPGALKRIEQNQRSMELI